MNSINLYKEFKKGQKENIIFELKGLISQDILIGFVEIIKNTMLTHSQQNNQVKKIFFIFIELFQNIVKHSKCINNKYCNTDGIGNGIIILKSNEVHYVISSGNHINNKNIPQLTNLINKINSLDKQGLKKFYKERLKADRKQGNNTGVGLIDIARKSGNPIECDITSINQSLSFCEITVKINKELNE